MNGVQVGMSDPFVCLCVCMFTSYVSQLVVVCLFVWVFYLFVLRCHTA